MNKEEVREKTNLEAKVHVQDGVLISHELNNHINLKRQQPFQRISQQPFQRISLSFQFEVPLSMCPIIYYFLSHYLLVWAFGF